MRLKITLTKIAILGGQLRDVEKSIYPMIMNNCQTKYTEARRQELAIEIDRLQ